MGYWWRKPSERLDPWRCMEISEETLLDFITFDVLEGYEFSDVDREHVFNSIKDGYVEGQINDWDWKTEQEYEKKMKVEINAE